MSDTIRIILSLVAAFVAGWMGAQRYALYSLGKLNTRYARIADPHISIAKLEALNDVMDEALPTIPVRRKS